jgi:hypothetical protein
MPASAVDVRNNVGVAKEIVVAWLSSATLTAGTFGHDANKMGNYIGTVYKLVHKAVVESTEEQLPRGKST